MKILAFVGKSIGSVVMCAICAIGGAIAGGVMGAMMPWIEDP